MTWLRDNFTRDITGDGGSKVEQNVHTENDVYEVIENLVRLALESDGLKGDIYGDRETIPH